MVDKGLISYFKVNQCGFYDVKKADRKSQPYGFALDETLEAVKNWVHGREFKNTSPVDISPESSKNPILCKSVKHNTTTGDYLFVFWQCLNDDSGKLAGVYSDSKVGDSDDDTVNISSKTHKGKPLTLGYPMYYWFIPEYDIFASIKFQSSVCNTDDVISYLKNTVRQRVPSRFRFVNNKNDSANPSKSITYRGPTNQPLLFTLYQEMIEVKLENMNLQEVSKKITHIVVRETISKDITTERSYVLKLWGKTQNKISPKKAQSTVEVITEVSLTIDELKSLLKVFRDEGNSFSSWQDIGFRTGYNTHTTKWFGSYLDRNYVHAAPDQKGNRANYKADYILTSLTDKRDELISNAILEVGDKQQTL